MEASSLTRGFAAAVVDGFVDGALAIPRAPLVPTSGLRVPVGDCAVDAVGEVLGSLFSAIEGFELSAFAKLAGSAEVLVVGFEISALTGAATARGVFCDAS